jgi:hypothetical protein
VLDLATGTGANLRHLCPHLPHAQHWLIVDHSPELLGRVPVRSTAWASARGWQVRPTADGCAIGGPGLACQVETRALDLAGLPAGLFEDRHLVTASALLDLTSERWLSRLAARCCAAGAVALFALTYNGRSRCTPPEPEDGRVRDLFNRHQHRDKGLGGPAAGPDAARAAARWFAQAGFQVRSAPSDWVLGPGDGELQRRLIDGWADAALETAPAERARIGCWRARRLEHVEMHRSRVVVGHVDLAAWLPAGRRRSGP